MGKTASENHRTLSQRVHRVNDFLVNHIIFSTQNRWDYEQVWPLAHSFPICLFFVRNHGFASREGKSLIPHQERFCYLLYPTATLFFQSRTLEGFRVGSKCSSRVQDRDMVVAARNEREKIKGYCQVLHTRQARMPQNALTTAMQANLPALDTVILAGKKQTE